MGGLSQLAQSRGLPEPSIQPELRWVDRADGHRIAAWDWGGEGEPILFLHGGALSAHSWDLLCPLLRSTHHCIAVDLRGHGDSDWAESYRIADHVSDIVRVAEGFKLDRAHIVGMSLGGVVAAYVALDSSGFDAASLALVDVAPGVVFENTRRLRAFVRDSAVADGVDALIEQARRYGARGSEAQLYYRYSTLIRPTEKGGWRWKYDPDGADFPHILNHIAMLDSRAGEMRLPLLVVRGGSSQILSDAAAARFAGLCPQGRWCVVADAGHTVQEDNPLGLSEALIQFWSSRPALR